jgi:alcohol dehydrogenase
VFHAPGEPLTLERFPIPPLSGGAVLARIRRATICSSDVHSFLGRRPSPTPCILGHEMVGEVAAVGPDGACDYRGAPLTPGDRIAWSIVWSCGKCFFCSRGLQPKCEFLMKFGHQPIANGWALNGGMAQYCLLPEGTAIFRVPPSLPDALAGVANCATATVAAVFREASVGKGDVVVVHGAGLLGLTACAMAAAAEADHVIAIEPNAQARERALRFGAGTAIDSALPPAETTARVKALSGGRGADACLEFAGVPEAVELGVGLLRMGGRLAMAGAVFPGRPVQLSAEQLVRGMIRIAGVHNYSPEDLETALAFLAAAADRYPFAELAGPAYALRDVNAAMAFAQTANLPRVSILP